MTVAAGQAGWPGPFPGFQSWQLLTVPRPAEKTQATRWMTASIQGAVTAAHARLLGAGDADPALLSAWLRAPGDTRMQFVLAGRPVFPAAQAAAAGRPPGPGPGCAGDATRLLFPPGATAAPVDLAERLRPYSAWVRCVGTLTLADEEAARPGPDREDDPALAFDRYAAQLPFPFAWLVVAEPVPPKVLEEEAARLGAELTLLRKRESSESHRTDLERGQQRYRALVQARSRGLWNVHVLAGGVTSADAQAAAMTLASAIQPAEPSWALFPVPDVRPLEEAMRAPASGPDHARSPFLAGADTVAALTRPPARELPGIRLVSPYDFDVTPETPATPGGIVLGQVLDEGLGPAGELAVSRETLNRHGFICGATGSGKSQTARALLESLSRAPQPVPWLVLEPAKAEYARMRGRLDDGDAVLVVRPGDLLSPPASLNPLEPEPGFELQSHADLVRALFLAAFQAEEPFPQVLAQALTDCYSDCGWDLVSGELRPPDKPAYRAGQPGEPARRRYPTLRELQSAARSVVDRIGYGREIAADVRGFVDVRIGSLRTGTPGRFFEGGHPLDIGQLLTRNVVLELDPITSDQDKAFLMGAVLVRVVEHLRVNAAAWAGGLRHLLLIEEAHRLLKKAEHGPATAAVELFASLLAEIRAYGEGVVVVEQIPAKIAPDVIKNTALKIMHRLPARDDREAVGATMNLTDRQSESVVSLAPGLGAVTVDGADHPLLVAMPPGVSRESADGCDRVPPLSGRRSVHCGTECQSVACTLRQLNDADAAARSAVAVVWTESVAATALLGVGAPAPRPQARAAWPEAGRELDCALASAADAAIDARRSLLRPWADPDDFGRHLVATMRALLAGREPENPDPGRWQAGYYRYIREWVALDEAAAGLTEEQRTQAPVHPDTGEWRQRGLLLEGASLAEQLAEIALQPSFAPGSKRVVLGDPGLSGLHRATTVLAGGTDTAAMTRALRWASAGPGLDALVALLPEISQELS